MTQTTQHILRFGRFFGPLVLLSCIIFRVGGAGDAAVAAADTFSISGMISGGPNVAVTLSGSKSAATTTDQNGRYSFDGLLNGSYTVKPIASGCFSLVAPQQQVVMLNGSNASDIDFAGSDPKLSFCDDFSGSSLGPAWYAFNRFGDMTNGEVQCYSPPEVRVSGGYLIIATVVRNTNCDVQDGKSSAYASGQVAWSAFSFTYGTLEIRAKMTGGQGSWPALWLLGTHCQPTNAFWSSTQDTCNWPAPGSDEVDIAEIVGSNFRVINQQIHSAGHNDGCQPGMPFDPTAGLHVYQLVWSPGTMVWKVDGVTTCAVNQPYIPSTPMFLIMNNAVGGSAGAVKISDFPQVMQIDYVKVLAP